MSEKKKRECHPYFSAAGATCQPCATPFLRPILSFPSHLFGKRVWDRMQKCRLQKRTEIKKQYCIQIDTIYHLSLFSFALFANMEKDINEQRSKMSKTVLNEDRQREKEILVSIILCFVDLFAVFLCLMSYVVYLHDSVRTSSHTYRRNQRNYIRLRNLRAITIWGEGVTLTTISGGMSPQLSPSRST